MAERQFRFRLPWLLSGPAVQAPRPTPRPTVDQIPAPTQPTTTIPIQRPPFRPAGIAPPPPTQSQAPQRTEPQTPVPPRATTESQVTSQPASPARGTTQPQAASVPPSPTRIVSESRVTSQQASPSRATNQIKAASQPQSPSHAAPQSRAPSVPPSPSRAAASQRAGQRSPKTTSPSKMTTQEQATISQNLSPSKILQGVLQETSKPAVSFSSSQISPPMTEPVKASGPVTTVTPAHETAAASQKSELDIVAADHPTSVSEPVIKEMKSGERKKATQELKEEEKTTDPAHEEEPMMGKTTKRLTAASGSRTQTKEFLSGAAFLAERQQKEKEDGSERRKASTIRPNGERIKTVSLTRPRARSTVSESPQKTSMPNGEQVTLHKEIKENVSKFIHKLGVPQPKRAIGDKPVSIITLAGENKGASMHMGSESRKKEESVHIYRGYKLNPDDSAEATTDGEGSSKGKTSKDPSINEDQATKAYINSNIQSINNSILLESTVSGRNPGVHLDLSYSLTEATKSSTRPETLETRKAEFNITPAAKHTYEPRIRRRCLRGLFLEPSDSEPDNPEKPRRHGCRYCCSGCSRMTEKKVGDYIGSAGHS